MRCFLNHFFFIVMVVATVATVAAPSKGATSQFYWTSLDHLYRSNLDGGSLQDLGYTGGGSLAFDPMMNDLYLSHSSIQRYNLDGQLQQTIIPSNYQTRQHAIDPLARKLYWVTEGESIMRADLDGGNIETIVSQSGWAWDLEIDPIHGKIYWVQDFTDNSDNASRLKRANLDGTGVETLIAFASINLYPNHEEPLELELDPSNNRMYWIDYNKQHIQQSDLDGTGVATIVDLLPSEPVYLAHDSLNETFYWAGYNSGINRVNVDGSGAVPIVPSTVAGGIQIGGLLVIPEPTMASTVFVFAASLLLRRSQSG